MTTAEHVHANKRSLDDLPQEIRDWIAKYERTNIADVSVWFDHATGYWWGAIGDAVECIKQTPKPDPKTKPRSKPKPRLKEQQEENRQTLTRAMLVPELDRIISDYEKCAHNKNARTHCRNRIMLSVEKYARGRRKELAQSIAAILLRETE